MTGNSQGISGDFPNQYSTIFAITYQLEMLEWSSNPLKARTIAENVFKSRVVSRQWFSLIFELPRDVDIMDCFYRPVKTSCGFVNMARKA